MNLGEGIPLVKAQIGYDMVCRGAGPCSHELAGLGCERASKSMKNIIFAEICVMLLAIASVR